MGFRFPRRKVERRTHNSPTEDHDIVLRETQAKTIDRLTKSLETSISREHQHDQRSFLDLSASIVAPTLAVSALLLYGGVALVYDQFYTALGVSPADVGLSYSSILAGSVGIVVYGIIALSLGVVLGIGTAYFVDKIRRRPLRLAPVFRRPRIYRDLAAGFMLALLVVGHYIAINSAKAVQQGRPVVPGRIGPLVTAIGSGAKPAMVMPTGKGMDAPDILRLSSSNLFYLGQANGTMVLYDSTNSRAIYLPSSAVRLNVWNCLADSGHPRCDNMYGGNNFP